MINIDQAFVKCKSLFAPSDRTIEGKSHAFNYGMFYETESCCQVFADFLLKFIKYKRIGT